MPVVLRKAARPTSSSSRRKQGRVENRLSPALPHQTVHAVFPHTAFRCSSCGGMRRFPAGFHGRFIQPVALIQVPSQESDSPRFPVPDLVAFPQVSAQSFFRVAPDLAHRQAGIPVVEVVHPASQASVHILTTSPSGMQVSSRFVRSVSLALIFFTALSDGRTFGSGLPSSHSDSSGS